MYSNSVLLSVGLVVDSSRSLNAMGENCWSSSGFWPGGFGTVSPTAARQRNQTGSRAWEEE